MRHAIILVALMFVVSVARAQPRDEAPDSAATRGLSTLRALTTQENFSEMGFESLAEVSAARIGVPVRTYYVPLDRLKEYQSGMDPNQLLAEMDRVIYPVAVEEQVRSSVVVESVRGVWEATNFGAPKLTQSIARIRDRLSESDGLPISSFFLVRIPAMNLYFIGYRRDDSLMLAPIFDNESFGFVAGQAIPVEAVLEVVVPAAKEYNDEPG